jgi:hypothetical protein
MIQAYSRPKQPTGLNSPPLAQEASRDDSNRGKQSSDEGVCDGFPLQLPPVGEDAGEPDRCDQTPPSDDDADEKTSTDQNAERE